MKKGGAGKANWGTFKDEDKQDKEERVERVERRERREDKEEDKKEEVVEEKEVEVLGLTEYKSQMAKRERVEKVVQNKPVDFSSIEKEGLVKMTIKKEIANDDKKNVTLGKQSNMYSSQLKSENKEMLGLSTGFNAREVRQRDNKKQQNNNNKKNLNVEDVNSFPTL